MRKATIWSFVLALLLATVSPAAFAAPPAAGAGGERGHRGGGDNVKPNPLAEKQDALRRKGLQKKLAGKAPGKVAQVAKGQYVELEQTGRDRVFVILAEFGDERHESYLDLSPDTRQTPATRFDGPAHNQIPRPDRAVNNTTIWQADYDKAHYEHMYFTKLVDYYRSQSSGRYAIDGAVHGWVKVPYNEARYGRNDCGYHVCANTHFLIRDAINAWTRQQLASGKTLAEVRAYLDTFDVWDRYDHDGDGDFDEKDGYIDHFQIVHAGEGEETRGGQQGEDAIWSHRWYAFYNLTEGSSYAKFGGAQFGDTGMWVADYTIQPENGGLGVFAHEYLHDLGLPDQYDTAGGQNSTAFWTVMSGGSYLGDGTTDIGSRPGDLTAWEKLQLGWLTYDVAQAGTFSTHRLGPAEATTKQAQALVVNLPPKKGTELIGAPFAGSYAWYGGKGDGIDTSMHRALALPEARSVTLALRARYQIEQDWDYAYVRVSTDNGATWTNLAGDITTNENPNGQNLGNGITGASNGAYVAASFDLTPYAGKNVLLGFRYWTDPYITEPGILFDDIRVAADGAAVLADGAEASPNGWTLSGFRQSTGVETTYHPQYYLAEYRQYRGYDAGLKTGPYNFGFFPDRPAFVEHFPYQDGLLISLWDTSQADNNTSQHPGEGLILPIDAHPAPLLRADGRPWRSGIQSYDSTFGLQRTDPITLHFGGQATTHRSLPAAPRFSDLNEYWSPQTPLAGVKVPKTGTVIEVVSTGAQGSFMQVNVRPAK